MHVMPEDREQNAYFLSRNRSKQRIVAPGRPAGNLPLRPCSPLKHDQQVALNLVAFRESCDDGKCPNPRLGIAGSDSILKSTPVNGGDDAAIRGSDGKIRMLARRFPSSRPR